MTQPETDTLEHHDIVCRINPLAAEKLMKITEMEAFQLAEEETVLVDFLQVPSFVRLAVALDKENKLTLLNVNTFGLVFDNDGDLVSETQAYRHRLVPWANIRSICVKRKVET